MNINTETAGFEMNAEKKSGFGSFDRASENINLKNRKKIKKGAASIFKHFVLIIVSIIMFFPFIWMVINALKPVEAGGAINWGIFKEVWEAAPIGRYLFNSFTVSLIEVTVQVIGSAMIAYALTQMKFKGRKVIFAVIMCTYMLPAAVTYVPCYILIGDLGLLDSLTGIVISNLVNVFGIFLMRQAFLQVDKGYIEAARIDGASHFKILWKVMFPLTKPAFITLALINFVTYYNEYMYPTLLTKDPDKFLISAGVRQFFMQEGAYGTRWPQIMAAGIISVIPLMILFIIAQKWFMDGVAGSSGCEK